MPFRVKNISKAPAYLLGVLVDPNKDIDLLEYFTREYISESILYGELYQKLWGRMFSLVSPGTEVDELSLTEEQYSTLAMSGIWQGKLGNDDLKPPFKFDPETGEVLTKVSGIEIDNLTVNVKLEGDAVVPADRDLTLVAGTSDGTRIGTVRVAKVGADGNLQVIDSSSFSRLTAINDKLPVLGGAPSTTSLPVTVANDRTDGYKLTKLAAATNVAINTYSYYIDMLGWRYLGLWLVLGGNTTAKIFCSGEFDVAQNVASYVDATDYLFSVPTLLDSQTHMLNLDTPFPFRWIRVNVYVTGAGNSHNIWAHQLKAL